MQVETDAGPSVQAGAESWRDDVRVRALRHAQARPARMPRSVRNAALAIAVLLHLAIGLWFARLLRERPGADDDRIRVTLIEAPPPEPALPLPLPPPLPAKGAAPARERTAAPRITEPISTPRTPPAESAEQDAPHVRIFNADGSIALPAQPAGERDASRARPDFVAKNIATPTFMPLQRPIKIRPNHFDSAWKHPRGETALSAALARAGEFVEKHMVEKEFTLPSGAKIKCKVGTMLIVSLGVCGWGYPPPVIEGEEERKWKPATQLDEY